MAQIQFKYVVNQAGDSKQEEHLENMKKIGKGIGLKFDENVHIGGTNIFASSTFGKEYRWTGMLLFFIQ